MAEQDLTGFAKSITETKQFKRLKKIKQYGLISKIYPTANTNRYDHCKGVYMKAKLMLEALEKNTGGLIIPLFLRMCVEIAALLHDVGHGPFSHQWEDFTGRNYKHEQMANALVDQIYVSANLKDWIVEEDQQYGNSKEIIKALINGGDRHCLKDEKFHFLFEIINNEKFGLDVDKWDYLQRDYPHAKNFLPEEVKVRMDTAINFDEVFLKARVSDNRKHIEYRYDDFEKIYNIYYARQYFHMYFYRMPKTVCLDQIAKKIINENKDRLEIDGTNVLDIRSNKVDVFLKLHDDTIWREIEKLSHPLVAALLNADIEEVNPTSEEEQANIPDYFKVDSSMPYPKECMKIVHLYGKEIDKPNFPMEGGTYKCRCFFGLK